MAEKTREELREDGFFITGDLAMMDPDGYVTIVGRNKDLIISGGYNIYPKEIELLLDEAEGVLESAVVGVPHPRWSERPLACIVVEPGQSLTKEEVVEFLVPRLAKWQLPDDVVFIDEVPKTSVGKFSKKTLRDRFATYVLPTI